MEKDTPIKLIEAATVLFAQKGFAAVSVRELSQASGVNSALISYHFGNKEGLYRAVLETHFSRMSAGLEAIIAENQPPIDRLIRFANLIAQLHQECPYLIRLISGELINPSPCLETTVKQYIERNLTFLLETMEAGVVSGDIRAGIKPQYAGLALAGIINFYFLVKPLREQLLPPNADGDREYVKQAIDIYLNGIRGIRHE